MPTALKSHTARVPSTTVQDSDEQPPLITNDLLLARHQLLQRDATKLGSQRGYGAGHVTVGMLLMSQPPAGGMRAQQQAAGVTAIPSIQQTMNPNMLF